MRIIGIESSCDETAAAVVEQTGDPSRPWRTCSSVIASQVEIHRAWGGVVPELASRQHLRDICGVVERALTDARTAWEELDAIAVTAGPGLIGSLLVGVAFAKAVALARGLPLVGVHHLAGHIESLFLDNGPLPLPAVVLVVSGGHTSLYLVPEEGEYRLLGKTRDDAAGEAYDKVAKLLGLGYPGGPIVDRLAREADDRAVDFPVARMTHADRAAGSPVVDGALATTFRWRTDFSFSGIKTAVLRHVRARYVERMGRPLETGTTLAAVSQQVGELFSPREVADICASFQRAVVTALLDRTFAAARWFDARSVGIAGGVSANSRLRRDAVERGETSGRPVFLPTLALSTDNAAMIAAAGLRRLQRGETDGLDLNADAALRL